MTAGSQTAGPEPGEFEELHDELHDELRAVARDLLSKIPPPAPADWGQLAASGWLGLEVPDAQGGAGATFAETAVILTELGRAATSSPYLGAIAGGVGALLELAPSAGRDELLRQAAAGEALPVAVLADGSDESIWAEAGSAAGVGVGVGGVGVGVGVGVLGVGSGAAGGGRAGGVPFRLERTPGGLRLRGHAGFVPDAAEASTLLLLALDAVGEPVIVDRRPGPFAIGLEAQPVLSSTRRLARVTADGAEVPEESVWRFAGDPGAAVGRLRDRAAVAVACDSLGLSEAMLSATVAYAGVRQQFGRPIGSFQAVQHACADLLVQVSVSRELVRAAAARLASRDPEASVAAAMAKAHASATAVEVAGKAMQLHGGIGYTWESGIHVYLKRAALNRSLFGSPAAHRRRLAARYLGWPGAAGRR
jgi:alkylation response protein AidB-like acyl-CoA dehydrogenase